MKPKNIIFFFPYNRGAGGVNILFLKLANHLAMITDLNIYLGDYENGYMITNNRNPKVKSLYLISNKPMIIPHDSIIICQTMAPWMLLDELKFRTDTKILFWNLHPYNLLWYFSFAKLHKTLLSRIIAFYPQFLMKKFVDIIIKHKGIVFMDAENRKSAEKVIAGNINIPFYLPVFSDPAIKHSFRMRGNFVWLGRLADFKVSILIYIMKKMSTYSLERRHRIKFYIIGDGPQKAEIQNAACSVANDYFEIIFIGEIENEKLADYLRKTASVLFAMGVSALDGARIGLPTILLDFSYESIDDDYDFNYLFETEDYTLGREISSNPHKKGNHSLENMIDELYDEDKYQRLCDLCFEYYKSNHDINAVANKLLKAVDQCVLRYKNIRSLRRNFLMTTLKAVRRLN